MPAEISIDRQDSALRPGAVNPRTKQDFEDSYATTPAWDIGHPQTAFQVLAAAGQFSGKLLDVGCGTGEHALLAASLGLETTGVDLSETAIASARSKADGRGLKVRFEVCSALELESLDESFDTALDSGLFHVLDVEDRARFASSLRACMNLGGKLYLLCFSDLQSGSWGPRRVSEAELRAAFADGWALSSIAPAAFELRTREQPASALLACITAI